MSNQKLKKQNDIEDLYFMPYQEAWILDESPLRIIEKSRQVGITYADAYDSVIKVSAEGARLDVWVSSRDQAQAKLYLEDCKQWAVFLHLHFVDLGLVILDPKTNSSAYVLQFANGRRIYCLSSSPNALAGKRGHVKLDEFALHQDQRLLYKVAKPVTTWGGQLSIISTHRGIGTVFNQIINEIVHHGNPKHWSHHKVPIQLAVEQGLVTRINERTSANETNEQFLSRIRSECIDEEQWNQEYCCVPADESAAFITHEMISACEDSHLRLLRFEELKEIIINNPKSSFYIGMDVARKENLCVIDLGEKIGDVMWDRCRVELKDKAFSEMEFELHRLLSLRQVKRACIDATGMGMQLAERAREGFGHKAEPITFTPAVKEELAFDLRRDFEDRKLRIVRDDNLRSDLRALKKDVTAAGNIRFAGESENSHCDRTWAMALRQHAARARMVLTARLG
jgi:phage FluMu gp28-like protein